MLTGLDRGRRRDVKRLVTSLDHLTRKHGPRTFTDLVHTSGRSVEYMAELCEWLVGHGYFSVTSTATLRLTPKGLELLHQIREAT